MTKKRVSAAAVALAALVGAPVAGAASGMFTAEPTGAVAASEAELVSSVDATAEDSELDADEAEVAEGDEGRAGDEGAGDESEADRRAAASDVGEPGAAAAAGEVGGTAVAGDTDTDAAEDAAAGDAADGDAADGDAADGADVAGPGSGFGIDPIVDLTKPAIRDVSFGPVRGVQTFSLSQDEANPGRAYVEIQQLEGGTWHKVAGQHFLETNEFDFTVDTDALADGVETQLKLSTWDASGNHASKTFPVVIDRVKPEATLVAPFTNAPASESAIEIELAATDDHGLKKLTANIYKDGKLVEATSSNAAGATSATHTADVELPDGEYVIRYNASDLAGNIAQTGQFAVEIDTTAPTMAVKDGAAIVNGVYSAAPSFTLQDAGQGEVDRIVVNDKTYDRVNAKWSDLNGGDYTAVQGENTVELFDTAGNSSSFTFVLDSVAPTITAKPDAAQVDGVYTAVPSFKLHDAGIGQIDYVVANGRTYDRNDATWSDLNAGDYRAVEGLNSITVYDTAGNASTLEFQLDTVAPEVVGVEQWYEAKEGGRTAVRVTFSEPIDPASLDQGWYGDGATFTKRFYSAKDASVSFADLVGHTGTAGFTVDAPVPTDDAAGAGAGAGADADAAPDAAPSDAAVASDAAVLAAPAVGTSYAEELAAEAARTDGPLATDAGAPSDAEL